jgi:DNA replication licensing factor MCM5
VNRLVLVPGIVINSSRTRPKAISVAVRCRNCGGERHMAVASGFGGVQIPRVCSAL